MKAIIVLATAIAAVNACTPVTLYQKNVHSESKPKGQINAIMITGAATGGTGGGSPTAEERCAYLYNPDIKAGSSTPKYKGDNWPYFRVGEGCNFVLDKSIPTGSKLREPGFVSIGANRALLIGGLPVYQVFLFVISFVT